MPSTILSASYVLDPLITATALWHSYYYYLFFRNEVIEVLRHTGLLGQIRKLRNVSEKSVVKGNLSVQQHLEHILLLGFYELRNTQKITQVLSSRATVCKQWDSWNLSIYLWLLYNIRNRFWSDARASWPGAARAAGSPSAIAALLHLRGFLE